VNPIQAKKWLNPITIAAGFGFLKGALLARGHRMAPGKEFYAGIVAPMVEEAMFRAIPFKMAEITGAKPPNGATAFSFAAEHIRQEGWSGGHSVWRFGEVFFGGILYEQAYKKWGWFGSVGAHSLHNIMVSVGSFLSGALFGFPVHTLNHQKRKRTRRLKLKR